MPKPAAAKKRSSKRKEAHERQAPDPAKSPVERIRSMVALDFGNPVHPDGLPPREAKELLVGELRRIRKTILGQLRDQEGAGPRILIAWHQRLQQESHDAAAAIRAAALQGLMRMLPYSWLIGAALLREKDKCAHGEWGGRLAEILEQARRPFGEREAQRHMAVAAACERMVATGKIPEEILHATSMRTFVRLLEGREDGAGETEDVGIVAAPPGWRPLDRGFSRAFRLVQRADNPKERGEELAVAIVRRLAAFLGGLGVAPASVLERGLVRAEAPTSPRALLAEAAEPAPAVPAEENSDGTREAPPTA